MNQMRHTATNHGAFWRAAWDRKAEAMPAEPLSVVDGYQFMSPEAYRLMIRTVSKPLGLRAGQSMLEVGCGAGAFLEAIDLSTPGLSLSGVDLSAAMVRLARQRQPHIAFTAGDIRDLWEVSDSSVDHVAAFAVLCYLDSLDEAECALDELVRVVRPGGWVFLGDTSDAAQVESSTAFLARAWAPRAIPEYLYFSPAWFARYARSRGLEVRIEPLSGLDGYEPAQFRFSVYLRSAS